ncbi:PDR/VanB family oxidoreductase [Microbacterium sediminicola]|uniref:PDR/VanB family oxidoreductase n=1 Tax=Microbacterium sediminicola TaxID=415210 RepID=A0ABN2IJJ1_9MICO
MSFFSDVEREMQVRGTELIADDILMIEIVPTNGRPLPLWEPGAHIDLRLPGGTERQYSLCGVPAERGFWRIAVLREPEGRGGSVAAHDLSAGQIIRVRGPRSHFAFTPPVAGERVSLVAGGIGITPILPMVHAAASTGADWSLDYAVRSGARAAFAAELADAYGERVRLHDASTGARLDVAAVVAERGEGRIWACGPTRLLDALGDAASGLEEGVLHTEQFVAGELAAPVRPGPFEVELASSGEVLTVPEDKSVLEVLEENDVFVVSSCREGTCGTCETMVLEGEVDHRDAILTPGERAENTLMMVCVSRAACPRLVLDV